MRRARAAFTTALLIAPAACAPAPQRTFVAPTTTTSAPTQSAPPASYPKTSTSKLSSLDDYAWPPAQGDWKPVERPWLHKIEGAPPTFYRTSVRPDPKRKVAVEVVALDARQLELEMALGKEGPWPPDEKKKGKFPRHGGKLPREPAIATRVVVAFNGGFRLDQNAWGMMIRRRVFAPPVKDVASLLMHDDGRLGFGTWGPDMQTPADVRSLRQNLDPLLDDGEIDPRHRKRWGGIIKATNQFGQRAKRTGICRTAGGHLLYLYGDAIEAADLGAAMKQVGCEYGMHLDMNVVHVGLVFMSFEDAQYKVGHSEVLTAGMGITEKRYIHQPNPKEFFYATLRAPFDPTYRPDGFTQPPPVWLPALVTRTEGDVRVTLVDERRTRFVTSLTGDDAERVLAAIDLGSPKRAVVVDKDERLQIPAESSADGAALAIGVNARGDLLVAERAGNEGNLVEALTRAGAVRTIALPSGKFERAGRDAIAAGGANARLYVLGERPPSATYRLDRDETGALRWPKVTTPVK